MDSFVFAIGLLPSRTMVSLFRLLGGFAFQETQEQRADHTLPIGDQAIDIDCDENLSCRFPYLSIGSWSKI